MRVPGSLPVTPSRSPLGVTFQLLAAVAALGLALPARAEGPPPRESQFFEALDGDRDGKVTLEEFRAAGKDEAAFSLLDRNQDGAITPEELGLPADYKPTGRTTPVKPGGPPAQGGPGAPGGAPAGGGGPAGAGKGAGGERARRMKEMDANGDGKVSRDEWKGEASVFDRMDRNKDGVLDASDMQGGREGGKGGGKPGEPEQPGQPREKGPGGPPPGGFGGPGGPPAGGPAAGGPGGFGPGQGPGAGAPQGGMLRPELVKSRWAKMDKDGDGKVSRDEYTGEFDFERLDVDRDGFLTDVDLKGLMGAMGGGQPQGPGQPGQPQGPGGQGGPRGPGGAGAPGQAQGAQAGQEPSPEQVQRRFQELDADKSGALEPAELDERMRERMMRADEDGDGKVSQDEFMRGAKRLRREGGKAPGQPGGPQGGPQGGPPPGGGDPRALLQRFDHDRDGKVLREQFPGSDEAFARLDRDGDGVLTEADFPPPPPGAPQPPQGPPQGPQGPGGA